MLVTEQDRYQVRFDFGAAGAAVVGGDILVWVDVLGSSEPPAADVVVRADFRSAAAVAAWILDRQKQHGRQQIAVIAAGAPRGDTWRYTVEDHLAAGAVIDALGTLGIDATSPEAAAAEAAYRGLGRAVGHMLTASVSGRETPPEPGATKSDPDAVVEVLTAP